MRALTAVLVLSLLAGCNGPPKNLLERIKQRGVLVVATRNSPTTYYVGPDGKTGLEYDLASGFAKRLGVKLRIVVPDRFDQIIPMVASGEADLAAAGLTVTEARTKQVRFGPHYQDITQQVVYRRGSSRPRDIEDLTGGILEVVAGSSHASELKRLAKDHPDLRWKADKDMDSEELLYLVWQQLIDYTVADSNEVALNQRFYPELRVAFNLTDPQPLAWAFARGSDDSLYNAANQYFADLKKSGDLEQLIDRYYGHVEDFDYVGTRLYLRHIKLRLPRLEPYFQAAGRKTGLDWRLLAAMGYQESHWNPKARSPTGVRGIMMLTLTTAKQLDVDNRLDPEQSIIGGARYFAHVKDRIPDRIPEPDRTWLALAAYNVGFGHLEDARKLTKMRGGDPDKWVDVKKTLPLLSQKKWYKRTRFGYARGREPVIYVENIRSYYDLLVWTDGQQHNPVKPPARQIQALDSPVL
ncbi:MAG: membrane-bound lytic murein transglycosylase MltF [Gammaproteobacteria bacterium]